MGTWRLETARAALFFFLKSQPVVKTLSFIAFQLALSYEVKRGAFISCGLEIGNLIWMFSKVWTLFFNSFFLGTFLDSGSQQITWSILCRLWFLSNLSSWNTDPLDLPWRTPDTALVGGAEGSRMIGWDGLCWKRWSSQDLPWKLKWCITPVKIKISWYTLTYRKDTIFQWKTCFLNQGLYLDQNLFGTFFRNIYMKHLQNFIYVNISFGLVCSDAACQSHPTPPLRGDHHNFLEPKFRTQLLTFSVTPKNWFKRTVC